MAEAKFRNVEQWVIAKSIAEARVLLEELYLGETAGADIQGLNFEKLCTDIKKASDDQELAHIIKSSGIETLLSRYRAVLETWALFEPHDPHQFFPEDSDSAYYLYKILNAWGAFEAPLSGSDRVSEEAGREIQKEVEISLICRYIEFLESEDFKKDSPAMLRLLNFCAQLNESQKHLGDSVLKAVVKFRAAFDVKNKKHELGDVVAGFCSGHPMLRPRILAALQEMSGLNFKKILYQDFSPFSRYTVVPHAEPDRISPIKLESQKQGVIKLLEKFEKAGDVTAIITEPEAGEKGCRPTLAFNALASVAAHLAGQFPSLAILDQNGKEVPASSDLNPPYNI